MVEIVYKTNPRTGRLRAQEADFDEDKRVVRVVPKNDDIRRYIKHPVTRVGFQATGSAEWPWDQFTKRRVRDGDVTVEEKTSAPAPTTPTTPQTTETTVPRPTQTTPTSQT